MPDEPARAGAHRGDARLGLQRRRGLPRDAPSCWPRSARGWRGSGRSRPGSASSSRRPVRWTTPETAPPGRDLPRAPGYELIGVLGRGGVGVVYKAVQVRLNRAVALKMLLAGAFATRSERRRFAARGGAGGGAAAPEHRAGLRRGRDRRAALLHHGVRRGGQPGRGHRRHAPAGPGGRRAGGARWPTPSPRRTAAGSCIAT